MSEGKGEDRANRPRGIKKSTDTWDNPPHATQKVTASYNCFVCRNSMALMYRLSHGTIPLKCKDQLYENNAQLWGNPNFFPT